MQAYYILHNAVAAKGANWLRETAKDLYSEPISIANCVLFQRVFLKHLPFFSLPIASSISCYFPFYLSFWFADTFYRFWANAVCTAYGMQSRWTPPQCLLVRNDLVSLSPFCFANANSRHRHTLSCFSALEYKAKFCARVLVLNFEEAAFLHFPLQAMALLAGNSEAH